MIELLEVLENSPSTKEDYKLLRIPIGMSYHFEGFALNLLACYNHVVSEKTAINLFYGSEISSFAQDYISLLPSIQIHLTPASTINLGLDIGLSSFHKKVIPTFSSGVINDYPFEGNFRPIYFDIGYSYLFQLNKKKTAANNN